MIFEYCVIIISAPLACLYIMLSTKDLIEDIKSRRLNEMTCLYIVGIFTGLTELYLLWMLSELI